MEKDTVLFYHANCPDGFGSAYAFWKKFGDTITYHPLEHEKRDELDLEEYKGKRVFMADIALERKPILALNDVAGELVVIDHHQSALEDIGDLDFCIFDMQRSGAVMSWDYLFSSPAPRLLKYIQDRDIWNWKLDNTDEALLYVDSFDKTFKEWNYLEKEFMDDESFNDIVGKGEVIRQYRDSLIKRLVGQSHFLNVKGYNVPAINLPFFRSEILAMLADDGVSPFAVGYNFDGTGYNFSLRSSGKSNGIDVSKIAAQFPGGGGHKQAAGFSIKSMKELV